MNKTYKNIMSHMCYKDSYKEGIFIRTLPVQFGKPLENLKDQISFNSCT